MQNYTIEFNDKLNASKLIMIFFEEASWVKPDFFSTFASKYKRYGSFFAVTL
ncbi:hypothetical protein JCM15124A_05780 [Prevotella falsenii]